MVQEHKELLLKDLCARLTCGVKCNVGEETPYTLSGIEIDDANGHIFNFVEKKNDLNMQVYLSEVKPYLFPLSSMTEKQKEEYENITFKDGFLTIWTTSTYDWFNKNHFDHRGLIKKGLAIDATDKNIY